MNNIDGSYYAACKLGYEHSRQKSEQQKAAEELKRYKEEKRRSWIQFWVPLIVSNLIAISALVVAILSYIKQCPTPLN